MFTAAGLRGPSFWSSMGTAPGRDRSGILPHAVIVCYWALIEGWKNGGMEGWIDRGMEGWRDDDCSAVHHSLAISFWSKCFSWMKTGLYASSLELSGGLESHP